MASGASPRLLALDWARSLALANMVAFHFLFDLRMYGLPPGWMTYGPLFDAWAKGIAGGFLFLAGLSLWLAHGSGFRAAAFWRRLAVLIAAAAVVSLATWLVLPQAWVRFGILHSIALSSVVALAFLRAPWWVAAGVAVFLLAFGPGLAFGTLNSVWLLWLGLGTTYPPMMDYEPLVPWLAPMLLGVAVGKLGGDRWTNWRGSAQAGGWRGMLAWPGRHSLAIYLLHQPVLIGGILGWLWLMSG